MCSVWLAGNSEVTFFRDPLLHQNFSAVAIVQEFMNSYLVQFSVGSGNRGELTTFDVMHVSAQNRVCPQILADFIPQGFSSVGRRSSYAHLR